MIVCGTLIVTDSILSRSIACALAARAETTDEHYAQNYVYNTQSAVSRQVMTQTIQRQRAFPWQSAHCDRMSWR